MLSESAADDLADIFENDVNTRTTGRNILSSFALDSKRRLHSRNIERQTIDMSGYESFFRKISHPIQHFDSFSELTIFKKIFMWQNY